MNIAEDLWEHVKNAPTAMHMWDLLAGPFVNSLQVTASSLTQKMISFRHMPGEAVTTSNLRMRDLLIALESLQLTGPQLLQYLAMEFFSKGVRPDLASAADTLRMNKTADLTLNDLQQAVVAADQRSVPQQQAAHSFNAAPSAVPVSHVQGPGRSQPMSFRQQATTPAVQVWYFIRCVQARWG
jgi:hypothetical protein